MLMIQGAKFLQPQGFRVEYSLNYCIDYLGCVVIEIWQKSQNYDQINFFNNAHNSPQVGWKWPEIAQTS